MNIVAEVRERLGPDWIPAIYRDRIRSGRTRAYKIDVAARETAPQIQYTLLGIELKVGRKRLACPDLATARYLRVFARLGCREIAIPYDISLISGLADDLETAWQRALLLLENASGPDESSSARSKLVKAMRNEITEIGPGRAMPLFDRDTRRPR
jgi:hypothetical protein